VDIAKLLFSFEGRIGRRVFLALWFAAVVIQLLLPFLVPGEIDDEPKPDMVAAHFNNLWPLLLVAFLSAWISLASITKRRHDFGKSGWPLLVDILVVIVSIAAWWFCAVRNVPIGVLASQAFVALGGLYGAWMHVQCLFLRGNSAPNDYDAAPGSPVAPASKLELRLTRKARVSLESFSPRPGSRGFGRR
jgi:uncharacterized membrane protein YhaH (DUF805 family)